MMAEYPGIFAVNQSDYAVNFHKIHTQNAKYHHSSLHDF